jgi:sulfur-oxidizing protein SoxX
MRNSSHRHHIEHQAASSRAIDLVAGQSAQPCSITPRFGCHKVLTEQQIKDVMAYLMSPDSPVNK